MVMADPGLGQTSVGHVFVSYVREDSRRVDSLCRLLSAAGIPTWRDTERLWPGDEWRAAIRQAIRDDALVFLACFSRQSVGQAKTYQNEELLLAIEEMRLRAPGQSWLIPVRFDDCRIPDRSIGGGRLLADLQSADLFGPASQQNSDRLVAAIRQILALEPVPSAGADGPSNAPADPASPGPPGQRPKYMVNIANAKGVQIGDNNIQHNTFNE